MIINQLLQFFLSFFSFLLLLFFFFASFFVLFRQCYSNEQMVFQLASLVTAPWVNAFESNRFTWNIFETILFWLTSFDFYDGQHRSWKLAITRRSLTPRTFTNNLPIHFDFILFFFFFWKTKILEIFFLNVNISLASRKNEFCNDRWNFYNDQFNSEYFSQI